MSTNRQDIPASWAAYERGGRAGSTGSGMSVQWDEESGHQRGSVDGGHLHPQAARIPRACAVAPRSRIESKHYGMSAGEQHREFRAVMAASGGVRGGDARAAELYVYG